MHITIRVHVACELCVYVSFLHVQCAKGFVCTHCDCLSHCLYAGCGKICHERCATIASQECFQSEISVALVHVYILQLSPFWSHMTFIEDTCTSPPPSPTLHIHNTVHDQHSSTVDLYLAAISDKMHRTVINHATMFKTLRFVLFHCVQCTVYMYAISVSLVKWRTISPQALVPYTCTCMYGEYCLHCWCSFKFVMSIAACTCMPSPHPV